jgi:hypothetical protein
MSRLRVLGQPRLPRFFDQDLEHVGDRAVLAGRPSRHIAIDLDTQPHVATDETSSGTSGAWHARRSMPWQPL